FGVAPPWAIGTGYAACPARSPVLSAPGQAVARPGDARTGAARPAAPRPGPAASARGARATGRVPALAAVPPASRAGREPDAAPASVRRLLVREPPDRRTSGLSLGSSFPPAPPAGRGLRAHPVGVQDDSVTIGRRARGDAAALPWAGAARAPTGSGSEAG